MGTEREQGGRKVAKGGEEEEECRVGCGGVDGGWGVGDVYLELRTLLYIYSTPQKMASQWMAVKLRTRSPPLPASRLGNIFEKKEG